LFSILHRSNTGFKRSYVTAGASPGEHRAYASGTGSCRAPDDSCQQRQPHGAVRQSPVAGRRSNGPAPGATGRSVRRHQARHAGIARVTLHRLYPADGLPGLRDVPVVLLGCVGAGGRSESSALPRASGPAPLGGGISLCRLGEFHHIDSKLNSVVATHVDVEARAKGMGVLRSVGVVAATGQVGEIVIIGAHRVIPRCSGPGQRRASGRPRAAR
jgi:hypothetical protein